MFEPGVYVFGGPGLRDYTHPCMSRIWMRYLGWRIIRPQCTVAVLAWLSHLLLQTYQELDGIRWDLPKSPSVGGIDRRQKSLFRRAPRGLRTFHGPLARH